MDFLKRVPGAIYGSLFGGVKEQQPLQQIKDRKKVLQLMDDPNAIRDRKEVIAAYG